MQLTNKDIRRVARRTVEALEEGGYRCCLFGSAACLLWGQDCNPNDIDIVVLNGSDAEDIKAYLHGANDRFSLVDSDNPRNTYKKLYYNISWRTGLQCKVDILTPGPEGGLNIPKIPIRHVKYMGDPGIPVMPFLPLLILKVQGWYDHRRAARQDLRQKVPQDVQDITELLSMADRSDRLRHFDWLDDGFIELAYTIIEDFCKKKPGSVASWNFLEFEV
jgi:hypothetical protein